ncbi:MAG TPA: hypothetical protein VEF06_13405 [Bryobacteraceae bacterium]|nr:hypothetical protein [Bryobacteraceae bacterium]
MRIEKTSRRAEKDQAPVDVAELVDGAIREFKKKLDAGELKGTLGDLIRLMQLRKEVEVKPRGVIRAMWVDECDLKKQTER